MATWIAGTLELSSKVRYGMTSRGVPIYRFIPYDRKLGPMAVGCAHRQIFYNVHAIVEPVGPLPATQGTMARGNLIQNLGCPTTESEILVMTNAYAFDNSKELRLTKLPIAPLPAPPLRYQPEGITFHIDPLGCKDVDDSITLKHLPDGKLSVGINIADVAAWIPEGCKLDLLARKRATSFYSPTGEALVPMLPKEVSEGQASLRTGLGLRPTLTLQFTWTPGFTIQDLKWIETTTACSDHYTYEEADYARQCEPIRRLAADLARFMGQLPSSVSNDSHTWIQMLMIFYNTQAGAMLKEAGVGILRRQGGKKAEAVKRYSALLDKYPELTTLLHESAEYCQASDPTTRHETLGLNAYAYASSPLRRYADLVNQRCLKAVLRDKKPTYPPTQDLILDLTRREKQAKAFSRDYFFLTAFGNSESSKTKVSGVVLGPGKKAGSLELWVPVWKRKIKVAQLGDGVENLAPGTVCSIDWWHDKSAVAWKEKIVFKAR